jgi:hypothetical protein
MHGLLLDVVGKAESWKRADDEAQGEAGIAEVVAYEDLIQSVLAFAEEYAGFEEIQRTLASLELNGNAG